MEILKINPNNPAIELLKRAAEVILKDGVIGYPTETVYGLGANALSDLAVGKIFELKHREKNKPILIIAAEIEQVKQLVAFFSDMAMSLANRYWPGPLTMVFEATPHLPKPLLGGGNQIGIRIPSNRICLELLKLCGVPITSTSANISGQKNPINTKEVIVNFGDKLDLIIDGGTSFSRIPSTVLKVDDNRVMLIRDGAISKITIEQEIGKIIDET
jgi:L-threonylcarbamoyladenylate synthase